MTPEQQLRKRRSERRIEKSSRRRKQIPKPTRTVILKFFTIIWTDSESAAKIRSSGKMFRGSSGLAGGGIYFADSPSETSGKAHNHGVIIKCEVDRGKVKSLGSSGDSSITHRSLKKGGFDSVQIARPGGTETVVYNHGQVRIKSMSNA